jgi:hypothetical protein
MLGLGGLIMRQHHTLPERRPEDVVAAALKNEELMRGIDEALAQIARGEPGIRLREVQAKERAERKP